MKKVLSLLLFAMLFVVLSGCKTEDTTTTTEEVSNYVQGVSDTEIKVGNCAATSGALAFVGDPFNTAIEAYFDMVNDEGGVNGRTINFVHIDDEFDPAKGKACVENLMNTEKIFAFVGHFGTPTISNTLEDIKDKGIPTVYLATGLTSLYNDNATGRDRVIYPVQPFYTIEGRLTVARALAETEGKKVGIIYTNDEAGTNLYAGAEYQINSLGDEYTLISREVTAGASDYSAAVAKMKQENVDAIIVAAIQASFPPIIKELATQEVNKPVFTTYTNAATTVVASIKGDVGTKFPVYSNAWVDTSDEDAVGLFATEMTEYSGDAAYAGDAFAMAGWIAAHMFVDSLKNVEGELTWESYMDALESEPVENPFGGTISYADGQRVGTQQMALLVMNVDTGVWETHKSIASIESILGDANMIDIDDKDNDMLLYYIIGGAIALVVLGGVAYFVIKSRHGIEE